LNKIKNKETVIKTAFRWHLLQKFRHADKVVFPVQSSREPAVAVGGIYAEAVAHEFGQRCTAPSLHKRLCINRVMRIPRIMLLLQNATCVHTCIVRQAIQATRVDGPDARIQCASSSNLP
jgi:hypothetical protein